MTSPLPNASNKTWISSKLEVFDIYGTPVGLFFNNKQHYKTSCGGFMTILSLFGALAYLAFNISQVLDNKYTLTSLNLQTDRTLDISMLPIDENNFDFAVLPASFLIPPGEMDTYFTVQTFMMAKDGMKDG